VKGDYQPMIHWYNDIYQYSRHLSEMLDIEIKNGSHSNDPNQMKSA
jgi:hypothetical protein